MSRPSWDSYFIGIAKLIATRSTCPRASVGSVIVRNKNILATGYNGSPTGLKHCLEEGCDVHRTITPEGDEVSNCLRTVHSEINAIIQAAKNGARVDGADVYLTHSPCRNCYMAMINAGIRTIFYEKEYKLHTLQKLWEAAKLPLIKVEVRDG